MEFALQRNNLCAQELACRAISASAELLVATVITVPRAEEQFAVIGNLYSP